MLPFWASRALASLHQYLSTFRRHLQCLDLRDVLAEAVVLRWRAAAPEGVHAIRVGSGWSCVVWVLIMLVRDRRVLILMKPQMPYTFEAYVFFHAAGILCAFPSFKRVNSSKQKGCCV